MRNESLIDELWKKPLDSKVAKIEFKVCNMLAFTANYLLTKVGR